MIHVKGLLKSYDNKKVIDGLTFSAENGETICLMGPSGVGKTTLLRILAGLEAPDAGEITGVPKKVGMVFQEDRLCEELSAVENIRLVIPQAGRKKQEIRELIKEHLARTGLMPEDVSIPVSELSGGMRRRVAVVRAMMSDSNLLLLDEPLTGLDPDTAGQVIRYIEEERCGRTMLVVTHSEAEAAFFGGCKLTLNP